MSISNVNFRMATCMCKEWIDDIMLDLAFQRRHKAHTMGLFCALTGRIQDRIYQLSSVAVPPLRYGASAALWQTCRACTVRNLYHHHNRTLCAEPEQKQHRPTNSRLRWREIDGEQPNLKSLSSQIRLNHLRSRQFTYVALVASHSRKSIHTHHKHTNKRAI